MISAVHEAGQREQPFYLLGAGLPSLPRILAKAKSYAERLFDFMRSVTCRRLSRPRH